MVNGPDDVYVERSGRIERTEVRFDSERALRDAIERILAPLGRRVDELSPMVDARLADGSRVNVVIPPLVGRRARRCRSAASTAARPGPRRAGRLGHPHRGASRPAGSGGRGAAQHPDLRRHGIGQDDAAQRPLGLHRPGGAGGHDRGRGRASPAPAARGPAREPPGERRGPGRGDHPRPAAQRAADAPRPDRDRRGARGRGSRPAHRAQHRARRRALDRARQLARGCASPDRDPGADGRGRPAARGDSRAGPARDPSSSSTSRAVPTALAGWSRSARSSRPPAGSASGRSGRR